MEKDRVVVVFKCERKSIETDLEIPVSLTVSELVSALNSAYDLGVDTGDIKNCYLRAENPIVLLEGNRTLAEYGVRDGSILNY